VRDPDGLEEAMRTIDELEKTEIDRDVYSQYNEKFPYLLLPALGLVVLATGMNMLAARRIL
jgi:Ca-activated chloride channel family protein